MHKAFTTERGNFVNERRKFLFATPAQVRDLLTEKAAGQPEFPRNTPKRSNTPRARTAGPTSRLHPGT